MKNISLAKVLYFLFGAGTGLTLVSLVLIVVFNLAFIFGLAPAVESVLPVGINNTRSWPVYIEIDPEVYSLQSEIFGEGEIQTAQATVTFETPGQPPIGLSVVILVLGLMLGLATFIILLNLSLIFRSITEGETPFISDNIGRIRWIAGLVIFYTIVQEVGEAFIGDRIFGLAQNEGIDIVYRLEFGTGMILAGLIIFALAEVFRYGVELQTEADLTV
ncbi:MAG: DUF2975 domain-containing protein [Chloroflexota bacterium]